MSFSLHPDLDRACFFVADWDLCRVLGMNDSRYPWAVLVPRRDGMVEPFDLVPADQVQLTIETSRLAMGMKRLFNAHKMNIAALGNITPQLHVHVISRVAGDFAGVAPVWGLGSPRAYSPSERAEFINCLLTL